MADARLITPAAGVAVGASTTGVVVEPAIAKLLSLVSDARVEPPASLHTTRIFPSAVAVFGTVHAKVLATLDEVVRPPAMVPQMVPPSTEYCTMELVTLPLVEVQEIFRSSPAFNVSPPFGETTAQEGAAGAENPLPPPPPPLPLPQPVAAGVTVMTLVSSVAVVEISLTPVVCTQEPKTEPALTVLAKDVAGATARRMNGVGEESAFVMTTVEPLTATDSAEEPAIIVSMTPLSIKMVVLSLKTTSVVSAWAILGRTVMLASMTVVAAAITRAPAFHARSGEILFT